MDRVPPGVRELLKSVYQSELESEPVEVREQDPQNVNFSRKFIGNAQV